MSDRPIPFSAPMIRALLGGRKTQTRRVLKPQPEMNASGLWHVFSRHGGVIGASMEDVPQAALDWVVKVETGDRLWVREAWRCLQAYDDIRPSDLSGEETVRYEAGPTFAPLVGGRYRHARFMPRWASRLTLVVTDVRVQRVQDISEEDAVAEGCIHHHDPSGDGQNVREQFAYLWDEINGAGAWSENPWVTAITFDVVRKNIDQMEK